MIGLEKATMIVRDITPTKPVRGDNGYMGTCPACGKRKRLNQGIGDMVYRGITYKVAMWHFWCSCGFKEQIGSEAVVKARVAQYEREAKAAGQ